jgi:predicted TIM-barrel fold metal-dependent hydrolase
MKSTRRQILTTALAALPALPVERPRGVIVESHLHLFDPQRFPYSRNATYRPLADRLDEYARFVASAKIDHAVIVHPEPYQDEHKYLEYCFHNEPRPGFFKGTCLFDPIAPDTPARMETLVKRNPGRIVALRIHVMHPPGTPPLTAGPIKDRDLRHPAMKVTWRKAEALGLAIQMHSLPHYAPQIGELAAQFPNLTVILDHLGQAGEGTPAEFEGVLKLAAYPRVYMKYSGVNYSSKQAFPFSDVKPIVRRLFDAYGPDRMVWGVLGTNMEEFSRQVRLFEEMFDFAREADRAKIRGETAMKLYRFGA